MSNGKKRDMSPSLEISKRLAIFNTPLRPARSVLEINCETPSCSTPTSLHLQVLLALVIIEHRH